MRMLVQSVVSLAFLCSTPHFPVRSVLRAAIGEYLGVLFSYRRWGRVADHLHGFKPKPESGFRGDLLQRF